MNVTADDDINNLIFILVPAARQRCTVCRISDGYPDHRTSNCSQLVYIQRPSGRWLTAGIESEHQKLWTRLCNEVGGLRCHARECKFLMNFYPTDSSLPLFCGHKFEFLINSVLIIILLVPLQLGCCGNIDYKDWYSLNPPRPVPRSCCKQPGPIRCDTQDETQIYNLGCYTKVTQYLERNMNRIAISAFVVALFPLIGSILSIALAKNINKAKYEQMA